MSLANIYYQEGSKLVGTGYTGSSQQGYSVAAYGNTVVIGAPNNASGVGAVWVYIVNNGVWTQQAGPLVGSSASGNANQGYSVAIYADTIAVGGPADASSVGAVWIWTRSGTTWTQQGSKLTGSGNTGSSNQGYSISLYNNTLAIGGYKDNTNVGATWVFTRSGTTWSQQAGPLIGSGATGSANQGTSVSVYVDTLAIGGPSNNSNLGATWIYTRSGTTWTQQQLLTPTGNTGNSKFGTSVSLYNNTIAIGGPNDNTNIGATWIWTRSGTTWTQQQVLIGIGYTTTTVNQGQSISLYNNTLIIGGYNNNSNIGACWVWFYDSTNWTQQEISIPTGYSGTTIYNGYSVSLTQNGNYNYFITGGYGDTSSLGASWIFDSISYDVYNNCITYSLNSVQIDSHASRHSLQQPSYPSETITYLVVAGGGGGSSRSGGGAGAGGVISSSQVTALSATQTSITYTVTVGGGGTGGITSGSFQGTNGSNSTLSGTGLTTVTAIGGGAGGNLSTNALNGGSGGGGSESPGAYGTTGQGNNGANGSNVNIVGGGGGGAGAVGQIPSGTSGGAGGNGIASSITGSSVTYGGGGGGGSGGSGGVGGSGGTGGGGGGGSVGGPVNGTNGTNGLGGGGGGAYITGTGGAGGSGVVIVSIPSYVYVSATSYTSVAINGSNTVITWQTVGSGTLTIGYPSFSGGADVINLTNGNMFIGNSGNTAAEVTMSGDATISNLGVLTLSSVNSNPGIFNSRNLPNFIVNASGRITGIYDYFPIYVFSFYSSGSQSITSNSITAITNILGNQVGLATTFVGGQSPNITFTNSSGTVTINETGISFSNYSLYLVYYQISPNSLPTGIKQALVEYTPNGSGTKYFILFNSIGNDFSGGPYPAIANMGLYNFSSGDTLVFKFYQNSGSSVSLSTSNPTPMFNIYKINSNIYSMNYGSVTTSLTANSTTTFTNSTFTNTTNVGNITGYSGGSNNAIVINVSGFYILHYQLYYNGFPTFVNMYVYDGTRNHGNTIMGVGTNTGSNGDPHYVGFSTSIVQYFTAGTTLQLKSQISNNTTNLNNAYLGNTVYTYFNAAMIFSNTYVLCTNTTGTLAIASGTLTSLASLCTVVNQTGDISISSGVVTINVSGVYAIYYQVPDVMQNASTGDKQAYIVYNGSSTTPLVMYMQPGSSTTNSYTSASGVFSFKNSDTLSLTLYLVFGSGSSTVICSSTTPLFFNVVKLD